MKGSPKIAERNRKMLSMSAKHFTNAQVADAFGLKMGTALKILAEERYRIKELSGEGQSNRQVADLYQLTPQQVRALLAGDQYWRSPWIHWEVQMRLETSQR